MLFALNRLTIVIDCGIIAAKNRAMEPQPPSATSPAAATIETPPRSNLPLAIIAGIVAALIGAVLWAVITVSTGYEIGYMALGVGFLVGFAVRLGNGAGTVFGSVGAILALVGCLLGNFFSIIGFFANAQHISVVSAFSAIDMTRIPTIMAAAFNPMDLLFYGIAVYEGYRFSQRKT